MKIMRRCICWAYVTFTWLTINNVLTTCKKNIYFFLSIAYKRIGDTDSALRILNIAIDKIPKYYDALLFRGKLLAKQRKYI
jgi:tetratricopeptide (TPR) repeat protein